MKKLTSKGFGKVELMVCLCALLVLVAVSIVSIVNNNEKSNLNMFKKVGDNFAYKVSIYKDKYPRLDNKYYLDYLIDDKIDIELNNPTNVGELCSRYESYVEIKDNGQKNVVMRCGMYLVEGVQEKEYEIYEISEWTEEPCNGCQQQTLYSYKKDGKEVSSEYMLENEFIDFYNEKEGATIWAASEVEIYGENVELLVKQMYREKSLVKKID